jgi:hypothetical protein
VFLWNHQKHDPRFAPKPPEGLPPEMMLYRKFAKAYQWTPDQVRKLRVGELYWLPVIEEAEAAAVEQIQAMRDNK